MAAIRSEFHKGNKSIRFQFLSRRRETVLYRAEQRVIGILAFFRKSAERLVVFIETGKRFSKHAVSRVIQLLIIYSVVIRGNAGGQLFFRKQAIRFKQIEIYEIFVTGRRAAGLVRRIAVTRGNERKHLPIALPAFFKKIDKIVRAPTQLSDTVSAR